LESEKQKRFVVLANWKMHKTQSESMDYVKALREAVRTAEHNVEIILCLPFTLLGAMSREATSSRISVGGQNVHDQDWGAFTGEVSAPMLADAGVIYCMVGHSERRKYFGETDEVVNAKARALHRAGIAPIVCIGETMDERKRGLTRNKLERQATVCFDRFSSQEMEKTVILYEPIWAIGTGNIATAEQAEEAHGFIRHMLEKLFSKETASATRIVYGGSVKHDNVSDMLKVKDIDGVGAGSDSLDVGNFVEIVKRCIQAAAKKTR
jgi:triosephosphate isomerase